MIKFCFSVLGHEGIGEVVISKRVENGLPAFYHGDRVVFSVADSCDACQMCQSDMQECCASNMKVS